jgi:crotonobetainyl-CoA:carnitine CoA-transferase CaiB-like acyl-CoA transferase
MDITDGLRLERRMMQGILDGIKVLDFGRYIAAPFCCQLLADMGAEVVRVERPGGEPDRNRGPLTADGRSLYFVALNRNKKAITLDLTIPRGREILAELVRWADVLVHNQPAERAREMGLDYERLGSINPRLVYLAVSGFGSAGPYARNLAFDPVVQAMVGAAAMTGASESPMLSHIPYVDFGTALYGALGVTAALLERERSGKGRRLEMPLLGTGVSLVAAYGVFAEYAVNGVARRAVGNDTIYAVGGFFRCTDGELSVAVVGDALFRRLCRVIGRQDLAADPRFATDMMRYENRATINQALAEWLARLPVEKARTILADAGVPAGEVNTVDRAFEHPQLAALGIIRNLEQPGIGRVPVGGMPLIMDGIKWSEAAPAPSIGEHNLAIYDAIFGPGAVERFHAEQAI